jgi:hypothetical protein
MKMQHRSADNRAPDVPVPVRAAVGGGIVPFSIFVVSLDDMTVI